LDHLHPALRVVDLDGLKRWHRQKPQTQWRDLQYSAGRIVAEHKDLYDTLLRAFRVGTRPE